MATDRQMTISEMNEVLQVIPVTEPLMPKTSFRL